MALEMNHYVNVIILCKVFVHVLKLIEVVCQGETLCRQRVPKGSISLKKNTPIKVLLEPWHINNKIMQGMRISGGPYSFIR